MSQFLRPDGDGSQSGDWEPEPSDTTLWNVIDEAEANDADYAWHDACAGFEYFYVTLSNCTPPGPGTGTIRWRQKRIDGGKVTTIDAAIFEGEYPRFTSDEKTLTDDWVEETYAVTQVQMDSISDWNNISLRFLVRVSGGGKAPDPAISWAEFEVPDAAAPSAWTPKIIGPF